MSFDIAAVRARYPALAITDDGQRRIYLDNPAGTQVPDSVAKAMTEIMLSASANLGGYFASSAAADQAVQSARDAMADFLNAPSSNEIIFGQNMTTLTLHLSRSIGRMLEKGDQVIVSQMDHDANVWPWVQMARDLELEIVWFPFNTETFEFDLDVLDKLITDRTRLICVGGASNLTGTINDVGAICAKARAAGALSFVDAVQSAPHVPTDVQQIGCDLFVCSAYKFFGPHQGILWGRNELLEKLEPYKVRPAPAEPPWSFETGTQSHEGMVGTAAAIDYFAWIGESMARDYMERWSQFSGRRQQVHAALDLLFDYEKQLAERLLDGLASIEDVTVLGITDKTAMDRRVPTVSFIHATANPDDVARKLGEQNIFVWNGHNYAVEIAKALDIIDSGGAIRVGPVHYNTLEEIDATVDAIRHIVAAA
ncbi:MAG: cysteine desulfurase-like protein [Pseudomonadota bacterium]